MFFSGTYDHSLDVKNRLTVPAKARATLADGVTVVRTNTGCLQLWPTATYDAAAAAALDGVGPFSSKGQTLRRYFFGTSDKTDLDKAGRVGLTAVALAHAGLTKAATLVGGGDYLEVWDPDRYADSAQATIAAAAELLDV